MAAEHVNPIPLKLVDPWRDGTGWDVPAEEALQAVPQTGAVAAESGGFDVVTMPIPPTVGAVAMNALNQQQF